MNSFAQVVLEVEQGGHVFTFTMPFGSSYPAAKEAVTHMVAHVESMEQEALKMQQKAEKDDEASEGEDNGSE